MEDRKIRLFQKNMTMCFYICSLFGILFEVVLAVFSSAIFEFENTAVLRWKSDKKQGVCPKNSVKDFNSRIAFCR